MHGRKRAEYKAFQRDPKIAAGLAAKAQKWHALSSEIAVRQSKLQELMAKQKKNTDESENPEAVSDDMDVATSLALTEKMLLVNPDPLYLYNFRRELWSYTLSLQQNKKDASGSDSCLETELRVTAAALQNNPKAYGAWFHRKWVLSLHQPTTTSTTSTSEQKEQFHSVLQKELDLTSLFLQRDERNFHCWNYRRFVVSCLLHRKNLNDHPEDEWWTSPQVGQTSTLQLPGISNNNSNCEGQGSMTTEEPAAAESSSKNNSVDLDNLNTVLQTEWNFTTTKIQDNFSNFSAFHYRSKLLPWKVMSAVESQNNDGSSNLTHDILAGEWELWQNAVFTEPDDQTAWWYGRFLLDFMADADDENEDEQNSETRASFLLLLEQQIEQIRELAQEMPDSKWVCLGLHMLLQEQQEMAAKTSNKLNNDQECRDLLHRLQELDPDRQGRYRDMLAEAPGE